MFFSLDPLRHAADGGDALDFGNFGQPAAERVEVFAVQRRGDHAREAVGFCGLGDLREFGGQSRRAGID